MLAVSAGQTVFAYRTAIENSAADESVGRGEQILGLIAKTRTDLLQMEAGDSGFASSRRTTACCEAISMPWYQSTGKPSWAS